MSSYSITLRVRKAKKRDIGRNIVRIDRENMIMLNVQPGDIVSLIGKKESACFVEQSYSQDRGHGIIRMDSRCQMNTGTAIDDNIEIRKVLADVAHNVDLISFGLPIKINPRFVKFVKKKLNNYPVTIDDYIFVSIGISRDIKLKVVNIFPQGVCIIKHDTVLSIDEDIIKII